MIIPHPFPSYKPLTFHLAFLSIIRLLLYTSSSHCNSSYEAEINYIWYEAETYTTISP